MSLPHRHAFHRPTQFNSLDPHGRSVGTARFDAGGNKIDGEYNERGEPIGSPDRHNLPFSKNTMSREEDWRAMFPRPSIPTGPIMAPTASAAPGPRPAPVPPPRPVVTPANGAAMGASLTAGAMSPVLPAAGMNPAELARIASSAARTGFVQPSVPAAGGSLAAPAPAATPVRNVFQDRRDALKLAAEAGVGLHSGGRIVDRELPAVDGTSDPAVRAARDMGAPIATPFGSVAVDLPLSQRGAFAGAPAPTLPPLNPGTTSGITASLAKVGAGVAKAAVPPPQPPGTAAGQAVRSTVSNAANSVFGIAGRAIQAPGNFTLGLLGTTPAEADRTVGNAVHSVFRRALTPSAPATGTASTPMPSAPTPPTFPTPAPTYASTGSGPSPVPGSGNPDDLPATPDVSAFPRPQKRTTPLMDKPAQQY